MVVFVHLTINYVNAITNRSNDLPTFITYQNGYNKIINMNTSNKL